ncbi:DUF4376 domain-containing protein [Viridibacillus arvi]|uniref:DUF4376 domain-containing protein n=1 Tax=Viridibacillus arvi TaxID=263475 RepID=UPI0034CEC284
MEIYVLLDSDNRLKASATTPIDEDGVIVVDVEDYDVFITPSMFIYENGQLIKDEQYELNMTKKEKDEELNNACYEAISNGFKLEVNGILYHFSFDVEAQFNYQGAERLLSRGIVESIDFTVFNPNGGYERIPVDSKLMDVLTLAILRHKDSNVKRYREVLLPIVQEAKTVEEVKAVTW